MTLLTGVIVTLVVWAVSLVRSVRVRALIYSLPLPITVVLLATRIPVGTQQLLGVVLLNVFVAVVAWLHQRLRWHILLADLSGIAAYVAGSSILLRAGNLPFVPVLATAVGVWAIVGLRRRATPERPVPVHPRATATPGRVLPTLGKLLVLAAGALSMVGLGGLLHGMVVTFPYSGILVVIETRRELVAFRAHFTRNSVALLAFVAAYYITQDVSRYVAVATGWTAFLSCALLLHLTGRGSDAESPPQEEVRPSTVDG